MSHTPLTIAQFFSNRYSKRTRQRIALRAWEEDWAHKHRILIVDNTNKTEKSYSELMASSIFCLAIIGARKDGGWEADCFCPLAITGFVWTSIHPYEYGVLCFIVVRFAIHARFH